MHNAQRPFPISVRTGWVDYSPALRYHASQRIQSRLAEFASQIRAVTIRISDGQSHEPEHRRCDIEVMTTHAGAISASSTGVNLFALVDGAVDAAVEILRQRKSAEPHSEPRRRIA